ncbi:MAG TPA: OmpA family protein [Candidatus Kapabacteria bacterium]|nr:OmpA family protein [Candidatus Kapabacteria bacterium]
MKLGYGLTIVMLAALAVPAALRAQREKPAILAGPILGIGGAIDRSTIPVFGGSPDCGIFAHGTSFAAGAGGLLQLPTLFNNDLGAELGLRLNSIRCRLRATPVDPTRLVDNGTLVTLDREFDLDVNSLVVACDLLLHYRVAQRLTIAGGPSIGFRLSSTFDAIDRVLGPGDYAFDDGQRQHRLMGGTPLAQALLAMGPVIRGAYELPVGRVVLLPALELRADLLSPVRHTSWQCYQIGANLGLLFDLSSPAPVPADTVRPVQPIQPVIVVARERPRLSASIGLYAVDENNQRQPVAKVHVSEVLFHSHAPLIPAVFFEPGVSQFADRYLRIAPDEARRFRPDDLAGQNLLAVQHRVLDVVGYRMRGDTAARLTLYGSVSHGESPALARDRARSLQKYLVETWAIQPERIVISESAGMMERSNENSEDGRADNRRVEILSNHEGVLAPVATDQIVREFDPPLVKLVPSYEAEAGVKRWELSLTQHGRTIAHYSSNDSGKLAAPEMTWNLETEKIDSGLAPLVGSITVEDSTGAIVTAQNQVPLQLERRVSVVEGQVVRLGGQEQLSYSLVGFDYDSPEPGRPAELALREIADAVQPGATITITGYTDRIGEHQRNVELSAQRAARVAALLHARLEARHLKGVQVTTAAGGIEAQRFGNDVPEARMLTRGVGIVVEQMSPAVPR